MSKKFKLACCYKEDHGQPLYGVSFNNLVYGNEEGDNRDTYLFSVTGTNRVSVYKYTGGTSLELVQAYVDDSPDEVFYTSAWSYDEVHDFSILAVAGDFGLIRLVRVDTFKNYKTLIGHGNAVNELKFSMKDKSLLCSASKDYSVRLWNIDTGVCIAVLCGDKGHRDEVLSVDFSLDFAKILSCGMDQAIKVWNLEDDRIQQNIELSRTFDVGKENQSFPTVMISSPLHSTSSVHENYVDCVRWYGDLVLSKSTESKLMCWMFGGHPRLDIPEQRRKYLGDPVTILSELPLPLCEIWYVRFAIDPAQRYLACGNQNGKISVWDLDKIVKTQEPMQTLGHPRSVTTIRQTCFSWDSQCLVGVCDDGSVCVFVNSSKK
eukprot:m.63046 g.63046  ORF g.63046 m.63046 type:complete len:376 (+) comp11427_c0_seq2:116-1243(+)